MRNAFVGSAALTGIAVVAASVPALATIVALLEAPCDGVSPTACDGPSRDGLSLVQRGAYRLDGSEAISSRAGTGVAPAWSLAPSALESEAASAKSAPSASASAGTQPSMAEAGAAVRTDAEVMQVQAEAAMKSAHLYRAFGECVIFATKSWQESPQCPLVGADSRDELCSWWLEENCIVDPMKQCESVDAMCSIQTSSFSVTGLMPMLTTKPLMFMHIPKNGGTSIEEAAFDTGIMWGRHFMGGLVTMPGNKPCIKYHVPPTYLPDAGAYMNSEVFCVTRHPYQRIVSEYIYLLRMSWGSHFSPGLYEKPACSVDGLNHFVTTELANFEHSSFGLDCHMVPQHEYIFGSAGQKWCHHILKFDELPGAFNTLMEEMEYPVKLEDTSFENTRGELCAGLSTKDLSEDSKAMLDKIYEGDFAALGFAKG